MLFRFMAVHFVNVGNTDSIWQALAGGGIEAGAGPLQFRNTVGNYGLHALEGGEFYKELPLFLSQAMYASDTAIVQKREGLIGVMAAYADLYRWIEKPENKGAYIEFYKEATGPRTNAAEAGFLFDFVSQPGRLSRDLVVSKAQVEYIQQLNIDVGVQKTEVPYDHAVDVSMAKEAIRQVEAKSR